MDGSGAKALVTVRTSKPPQFAARAVVDERIGARTLEQKVAQLFIVTPEALRKA